MGVRIGCGLSTGPDPRSAAIEAAQQARAGLDGSAPDVVLAFCSGSHVDEPEATLSGVGEALDPGLLAGCLASGVLGDGREVERATGVAVWAAALDGGRAELVDPAATETAAGARAVMVIGDPHSFGAEVLAGLARAAPGAPLLGGIASARSAAGGSLLLGSGVHTDSALAVAFHDVEVLPCVSQGAVPLGPELTVTACAGNVVSELDGIPALRALRDALEGLSGIDADLVRAGAGLLLGVGLGPGPGGLGTADFLVRGIVSADSEAGTVTVAAPLEPGTVVQIHARDAGSADADLRDGLGLRAEALGRAGAAGALVFTCNGRGRRMFGVADHDARTLRDTLGGAPAAGFFAAGEIGPVGGRAFLHGFTATVAVFAA